MKDGGGYYCWNCGVVFATEVALYFHAQYFCLDEPEGEPLLDYQYIIHEAVVESRDLISSDEIIYFLAKELGQIDCPAYFIKIFGSGESS